MPRWPSLEERFWAAVNKTETCWLWTRPLASNGYGQIRHQGRPQSAHRVSYELNVGPIPNGLDIDHLCRVGACVNPAHLDPVTHRVNILRGMSPVARQARQTHCKNGHPLSGPNLGIDKKGKRRCLECKRAWHRAYYRKRCDAAAQTELAWLDESTWGQG